MRAVMSTALALSGALLASPSLAQDQQYEGLTLVVLGSQVDTNNMVLEAIKPRFEEATGANLEMIPGSPDANLSRILSTRGQGASVHVVFLEGPTEDRAIEAGVLQQLDYDKVPEAASFPDEAFPNPGYGVAFQFIRQSLCANTEQYAANGVDLPVDVEGWFDPDVRGKVLVPAPTNNWWGPGLSSLASHYGVDFADPDPLFERLESTEPQSLFTSSGDAQGRLQSGEVWLSPLTDGRCYSMKLAGMPMEFIPLNLDIDGKQYKWVGVADTWNIPANVEGPYVELAHTFINLALAPESTLPMVSKYGFAPAHPETLRQARELPGFDEAGVFEGFSFEDMYMDHSAKLLPVLEEWLSTWDQRFLN